MNDLEFAQSVLTRKWETDSGLTVWETNIGLTVNEQQRLARAAVSALQQLEAAQRRNGELEDAVRDLRSGLIYIRETYGELYGVGFERAINKADQALSQQPKQTSVGGEVCK